MPYAIDPDLASHLVARAVPDFADYEAYRAWLADNTVPYEPAAAVERRRTAIPGPPGAPAVAVKVYTPTHGPGQRPGLLYIHGGGYVVGGIDQHDPDACRIAAAAGAVVVSVEYRLAPEHSFPAALEDCFAALEWMEASAADLGIDPDRLAVGGESAGGGLAAGIALMARDRGAPRLCFQYLGRPVLDDRLETTSMASYTDTPTWSRPDAEFSWDCYLGGRVRGTADVSAYAAPARAKDLSGLPPTFLTACQFDPLRDEGMAYAQRLAQANVPTEFVLYPGTVHGARAIPKTPIARRMNTDIVAALRRGLWPGPAASREPHPKGVLLNSVPSSMR